MKLREVADSIFEQPHRTMRISIAVIALLIMSVMLIADHNQASAQSNTTWTATLSAEQDSGDEYGYEEGVMGSMTDDTFDLDGRSYTIDYIKWDESQDEIEFRMLECLKESEFVSLRIGSRTYSSVDRVNHSDADCEERRTRNQEFEFDASSNPLRDGRNYTITLTLRGSGGGITPPGNADWSTYIDSGEDNDEYGYEYNDFGTIGDRTFEHGGRTYTIDYIKWDDDDDEIEFGIEECLRPSDFTSLTIGSRAYSDPDQVSDSDSRCVSYPDSFQEFEFHNIRTNPMPEGSRIDIGLNLSGGGTTPTATATLPAPAAPSGLSRTSSGTTSIGVSWNSVSGATKYAVEYREDGTSNWLSASANVTGTSYTISGLRCSRDYDIQVKSYGNGTTALAQWSSPSGRLDASTASCAAVTPSQPTNARIATVPGAPTSLRVTVQQGDGQHAQLQVPVVQFELQCRDIHRGDRGEWRCGYGYHVSRHVHGAGAREVVQGQGSELRQREPHELQRRDRLHERDRACGPPP